MISSCSSQKKCINCGTVLYKNRLLSNGLNLFPFSQDAMSYDRKVWFRDSLVIAEGLQININTDPYGHETRELVVNKYVFMDLKKRTYYENSNFSDTASVIDKYRHPDSGRSRDGWDFYSKIDVINPEYREFIPDTVIAGISYKRVQSFVMKKDQLGDEKIFQIGYFRCDKKNNLFSKDRVLSETVGCPMLRLDNYSPSRQIHFSWEVEMLDNNLTPRQMKVFDAWEKYAENNPVK
jgi:hypothetical protein